MLGKTATLTYIVVPTNRIPGELTEMYATRFGLLTKNSLRAILWKLKISLKKKFLLATTEWGLRPYSTWLKRNYRASARDSQPNPPKFVCLLFSQGRPEELRKTVSWLMKKTYPHLDILLFKGSNPVNEPVDWAKFLNIEGNIRIVPLDGRAGRGALALELLEGLDSDYVLSVNAGDTFSPDFFEKVTHFIRMQNFPDIVYFDEDCVSKEGKIGSPFMKPDWSPELLLSINYLAHALIRKGLYDRVEISEQRTSFDTYDDAIYAAAAVAKTVAHLPEPVYHASIRSNLPECLIRSVETFFSCQNFPGIRANIAENDQIHVTLPFKPELVSIIIPNHNNLPYIQRCLSSLVSQTSYQNYEIILVDNASLDLSVQEYYREVEQKHSARVIAGGSEFNYSRFNNLGAASANGKYVLFLNNDIEIINPDWLNELVMWASIPEIGIVGPKLLHPDGTIQHAGIILGMEGHASHIFEGIRQNHEGIFGSANWYRNYQAVTGACMMMRKEVFSTVGGFDDLFQLVFSDVDICLRVIREGMRVVYNPFATLIHYEGKTRNKYIPRNDIQRGYELFKEIIKKGDPYFNPNLSYSVRIPTLKPANEENPIDRLEKIVEFSRI